MQISIALHNILGHPLALNKVVVVVWLREVTLVTVGNFNDSLATGTTLNHDNAVHDPRKEVLEKRVNSREDSL
jgi:hypothetical protein